MLSGRAGALDARNKLALWHNMMLCGAVLQCCALYCGAVLCDAQQSCWRLSLLCVVLVVHRWLYWSALRTCTAIQSNVALLVHTRELPGHPPPHVCVQYEVVVVGTLPDGSKSQESNVLTLTTPQTG